MTKKARMRDRAAVIDSTMPSAKYSCSGSPDMLSNGRTAIDGLSGSERLPPRPTGVSVPGRAQSNARPGWAGYILHRMLASIGEDCLGAVAKALVDNTRDADPAWVGQFQAGRDVHAVTVDVGTLADHVAKVDADAKNDPPGHGQRFVRRRHPSL